MREKVMAVLLVPVLIFPIVVIAAGGDLGIVWQEFRAFSQVPLVVTVYAQAASPTATVTASPTTSSTMGPTPGVTMTPIPGAPTAETPVLTRWGYISASIVLALIALWSLSRGGPASRSHTDD